MFAVEVDPVSGAVLGGVVVALIAAFLALPPVRRSRKTRLDEQIAGQATKTLELAKEEQRLMEQRWERQLKDSEERCRHELGARDTKIAKLEGRLEAVTGDYAQELAASIAKAVVAIARETQT